MHANRASYLGKVGEGKQQQHRLVPGNFQDRLVAGRRLAPMAGKRLPAVAGKRLVAVAERSGSWEDRRRVAGRHRTCQVILRRGVLQCYSKVHRNYIIFEK